MGYSDPPLKRLKIGDYVFLRAKVVGNTRNPMTPGDPCPESAAIIRPVNRLGQSAAELDLYVPEDLLITATEAKRAIGGGA